MSTQSIKSKQKKVGQTHIVKAIVRLLHRIFNCGGLFRIGSWPYMTCVYAISHSCTQLLTKRGHEQGLWCCCLDFDS